MFVILTLDGPMMQHIIPVIPECVWDVSDLMRGCLFMYPSTYPDAYMIFYSLRYSSTKLMGSVPTDHSVHSIHISSRWSIQFCKALPCSIGFLWLFYSPSHPFWGKGLCISCSQMLLYSILAHVFLGALCIWDILYYFLALLCQHVMYHSTCTWLHVLDCLVFYFWANHYFCTKLSLWVWVCLPCLSEVRYHNIKGYLH